MEGGRRSASARARDPRGVRAHPARLRRRPRASSGLGERAWPRARRRSPIATCALRGGPLGARARRASVARKLAAVRSFLDHLVRAGAAEQNPAELLPTPKARIAAAAGPRPRRDRRPAGSHPGAYPARDPRPGDVRARLLLRAALRGDRRPRRRQPSTSTPRRSASGQGLQDAHRADRRARAAGPCSATSSAPGRARRGARARPALFLSRRGRRLSPSDVRRRLARGCARPPSPAASRRTRCATRSRPTCSRAGPTCARSRSCSGTRASRRPRSTHGSSPAGFAASTHEPPTSVMRRCHSRTRANVPDR